MSHNHWETQPRKSNGEFTYRHHSNFMKNIIEQTNKKCKAGVDELISRGGSYGNLRTITAGKSSFEIHHIPAASVSALTKWKGPCIIMLKQDHKRTGSYGNTAKAARYRRWQAKLISEGKFLEAQKMDITNISRQFGNKYNNAIREKLDYEFQLIKDGVING